MTEEMNMTQQEPAQMPWEARMYPETWAGSYSSRDCTVTFYTRVHALLDPTATMLNVGAGRGANILRDLSPYRRKIQTFKGRVQRVIGLDVDPVVVENPDLDEAHVIEPTSPFPLPAQSVDLVIADHVLEHLEFPQAFAAEVERVLKPGGWLCARTPTKWGYIGIATRAIPNRLHTRMLSRLQPTRKAEDVFPTFYRMNTMSDLRKPFPPARWRHCTYGYNGVPGYHANIPLLFRAIEAWCWLMPSALSAKYHIFIQKK